MSSMDGDILDLPAEQLVALKEMVALMSEIPGISVESTFLDLAHGQIVTVFNLRYDTIHWMYVLARALDFRYGGFGWTLEPQASDMPPEPIYWLLRERHGPNGRTAAITGLTERIRELLKRDGTLRHFGLSLAEPTKAPKGAPCEACDDLVPTEERLVCASSLGPISIGRCPTCFTKGAEPIWVIRSAIFCGVGREEIGEIIQVSAERAGISLDEMEAYLSTPFAGSTLEAEDGDGEPEEGGESPTEATQGGEPESAQGPGLEEAP